jgi:SAM-dependent methyltransferase
MLPEEADLIGRWAGELPLGKGSVCLNIGSSTQKFRERTQPFIHEKIARPITATGCRLIHCDIKPDAGVDEVGDVLDPAFQQRLADYDPDLIICSNLLEHLQDPVEFARACGKIAKPGGYCLFTVPRSFPYHPDPLDTMYRPSPSEIAKLLPGWQVVKAEELASCTYLQELQREGRPATALARNVVRSLMPFYRPRAWYPAAHKLFWLFRPYRVSLVMLRKPEGA